MKKLTILFLLPFMFIVCNNLSMFTHKVIFDEKTFVEQRELWQASNVKNYQYTLLGIGFLPYEGIVIVENGVFKNDIPSINSMVDIRHFMEFSSIDEIYRRIEEKFLFYNNTIQSRKDRYLTEIIVEYDKTNHIPIRILYVHHTYNIEVDGTFHFEIKNFQKM